MLPVVAASLLAASPSAPPELGKVRWLRDFDGAVAQSKRSGRPLLVLFDEVPGCSTVRGFGDEVLSDPATVAFVESHFVPVAVFNNVGGKDRQVLQAFGEPSWNNPVVRIVDAARHPLAPRFAGPYTRAAFRRVLDAAVRPAPQLETLTVAASCFWECEAQLGRVEAVRASRVGTLEGEEVVEVSFDPSLLDRAGMLREASRLGCALHVFTRTDAEQALARKVVGARAVRTDDALRVSEKDTKFYLRRHGRTVGELSPLEATRMNAALRFGDDPEAARASCHVKK